jgi:N-acetylglucosaminyl-diphospho-decaprenol L-rhamnosyltransferase
MTWTEADYLIVSVNYRTPARMIMCMKSVAAEIGSIRNAKMIVIDNVSGDGSVEIIADAIEENGWQQWASVISSERNGGYSYGNNFAIRQALASSSPPEYIHLLNPDTEVRKNSLSTLKHFMDTHPKAGIAGSRFENPDGSEWNIAFRFPSILSEFEKGVCLGPVSKLLRKYVVAMNMGYETSRVDWLPGASMVIRRAVFQEAGLFDENYFLYCEETDFCLNAARCGWPAYHVPESLVMHIAGDSTGVSSHNIANEVKPLPNYIFESRRYYFRKNYGVIYAAGADVAWIAGILLRKFRLLLERRRDNNPPNLLSGAFGNSFLFSHPGKARNALAIAGQKGAKL